MEDSFTVQKTMTVFPMISIDQSHGQNCAHIRGGGVAVASLIAPVPCGIE